MAGADERDEAGSRRGRLSVAMILIVIAGLLFAARVWFEPAEVIDDGASRPDEKEIEVALPPGPGIFVIGNDRGMLRPCGCAKPVLGGIVRRGGFFARLDAATREGSAVIACGNLIKEGGRQQELKLAAFLDSMTELGVAALCPGDLDLAVGASFWRDVVATRGDVAPVPVCANLEHRGVRLFASHRVIRTGGRTMIVTGLVSPRMNEITEPGLVATAADSLGVIAAALEGEEEPADLVVGSSGDVAEILAMLGESGVVEKAARVLVLHAGISDLPVVESNEGGIMVVDVGQKGRDVAWIDRPAGRLEHYTLTGEHGTDDEQARILDFYRENVKVEGLIHQAVRFDDAEGAYAGSQTCAACHPGAHDVWSRSRHAEAFATLQASGDDHDPECVRCHVVDFDRVGGFDPNVMEPIDVQCEACHGPSLEHARTQAPTPRRELGEATCLGCHDLENSPEFRFEDYWPRIAHGK